MAIITYDSFIQSGRKPLDNGRGFAMMKFAQWVDNPILWLYEKQGSGSLFFEGTEDLRPILEDMYLTGGYNIMTERDQIYTDIQALLYMWNLKQLQITSLVAGLERSGIPYSKSPDISAILLAGKNIAVQGAKAGLWKLAETVTINGITTTLAPTLIGEFVLQASTAASLFGAVGLVVSTINDLVRRDVEAQRQAETITHINTLIAELKQYLGQDFAQTNTIGGWLGGLLDLGGFKIVKDEYGNPTIVDDPANPNNPNSPSNPENPNSPINNKPKSAPTDNTKYAKYLIVFFVFVLVVLIIKNAKRTN